MSKLSRITQKIFASSAGSDEIAQFGSLAANAPTFTTDPAVIQALSEYVDGWFAAVLDGNAPAIEDMNALQYLFSYQLAYILQQGAGVEWDAGTTYYTNSIAQSGGILYLSVADSNLNNAVSNTSFWTPLPVYGVQTNSAASAGYVGELIYSQNLIPTNCASTTTFGNVTSISLTAGDWEVTGMVNFTANSATCNFARTSITTTSGGSGTEGVSIFTGAPPTATYSVSQVIPNLRMSLASTTTVYITAAASYSGGTPQVIGHIRARRAR